MKLDRNTRRLLTHLQKVGVPQVTDITESLHILAQAGLIEYEAYKCVPDMVRAWAVLHTGEVDTDEQKDQEILTLRAELDRFHDEHPCLAPCEAKPTKEIMMAKFDLDMQNVEVSGMKLGSIIVHIDVPDTAFDVLATVYKEALPIIFGQIKRDVECRCAAHNGDKHPGTAM